MRENPWRANVDKDSPKHLVDQTLSGRTAIRAVSGPLAVHYCGAGRRFDAGLHPEPSPWPTVSFAITRRSIPTRSGSRPIPGSPPRPGRRGGLPHRQPANGRHGRTLRTNGPPTSTASPGRIPGSQGRWPIMLEAMRLLALCGPEGFPVACFDQYPFSLVCHSWASSG